MRMRISGDGGYKTCYLLYANPPGLAAERLMRGLGRMLGDIFQILTAG